MAYDDVKREMGRRPLTIVEIDFPRCTRTYGVAPCTAAVGVTGLKKCFNTYWTCQDKANFDEGTITLRFATERVLDLQAASELPVFPVLRAVSFMPTRLDPGRSLGMRSSITVSLQDFSWGDVGTDPYVTDRVYNPETQGTFFGRMQARWQFLENRPLRVLTGFLDSDGSFDVLNFVQRAYVTDRWEGPNSAGNVTIKAKDVLRAADKVKSNVPLPSTGALSVGINDVVTTLQLGAGQANEYIAVNWVRVGEEIMEVTAVDTVLHRLTVVRGKLPAFYPADAMQPDSHREADVVQACALFDAVRIDELVRSLLVDWAGIDPAYIPFAEWQDEADIWFPIYLMRALITEPIGVDDLLQELAQHNVMVWWDERRQVVRFKALQPFPERGAPIWTDGQNLIADSIGTAKDTAKRASQVWFYYGQRNPVGELGEASNYGISYVLADLDAELPIEYNERLIVKVRSRWLHENDFSVVLELVSRTLIEYRDTKTVMKIQIDGKDDDRWTGDQVMLRSRYFQDDEGAPNSVPFRIIEAVEEGAARSIPTRHSLMLLQMRTKGMCAIIAPHPWPDYLAATLDERAYGFIGTNLAVMSNGDNCYYIC